MPVSGSALGIFGAARPWHERDDGGAFDAAPLRGLFPEWTNQVAAQDVGSSYFSCGCPICAGFSPSTPQAFIPPTSGTAGNGLPIYSWDQAAAQLTRDSNGWSGIVGQAAVVTYAFRATAANPPSGVSGFTQFSEAQIIAAIEALALWSEVANITFVRVGSGTSGAGAYSDSAAILFGNYNTGFEGASAFAYFPGSSAANAFAGDIWVNITLASNQDLTSGGFGFHTLAHEIGHAIGLSHPADYDATVGDPTYENDAIYWQDSRSFTIMSYFGSGNVGNSLNGFAAGPQLHDIAAAQRLYGANMTTRTGDTIYGFNSNTGHAHFTITAGQSPVFAIWDAGGNDTLDLSGFATPSEIDLREESFSSAGPGNGGVGVAIGNIAIAAGVVIENAIGGSGDDTITGNSAANRLTGNAGADTLLGGAGIDVSVYSIASSSATWVRNPNGSWTVTAGVNGTDTLTTVEVLDFSDRDVVLDNAFRTFSGDGTSDLMWRNAATGAVAVWEMSGATQTNAYIAGGAPGEWSILGTGDFSGDGRDDIIWRNSTTTAVAVWANGANAAASIITGVPGVWEFAGVGDFNFDGRDDFLWRNTSDGAVAAWLMNGNAIATQSIVSAAPLSWDIAGVADFDGDGRDDILLRNDDGSLARWTTNGLVQTGAAIIGFAPTEWSVAGTGDFDGDGRADILWRNGNDGAIALWRMNGDVSLGEAIIGGAPLTWSIANVGDYNGDGRDDIMLRNADGTLALWTMNGFVVQNQQIVAAVPIDWGLI
jgi:hypothetical protein